MSENLHQAQAYKRLATFLYKKISMRHKEGFEEDKFQHTAMRYLFRTLHSLAFRSLGIKKEQVMKSQDYREFGLKCGIPIKTAMHSDEDGVFNSDNEYLENNK